MYEPSDLPVSAFVSNAKGSANIAAHAQPISKNDTASKYWSWMKYVEMKPAAPSNKLTEYAVLGLRNMGMTIAQRIEPTA